MVKNFSGALTNVNAGEMVVNIVGSKVLYLLLMVNSSLVSSIDQVQKLTDDVWTLVPETDYILNDVSIEFKEEMVADKIRVVFIASRSVYTIDDGSSPAFMGMPEQQEFLEGLTRENKFIFLNKITSQYRANVKSEESYLKLIDILTDIKKDTIENVLNMEKYIDREKEVTTVINTISSMYNSLDDSLNSVMLTKLIEVLEIL